MKPALVFPKNRTHQFETDNEFGILKNIAHINVFVGSNNSGKSKLLRSIMSEQYAFKIINTIPEPFRTSVRDQVRNIVDRATPLAVLGYEYEHFPAAREFYASIRKDLDFHNLLDFLSLVSQPSESQFGSKPKTTRFSLLFSTFKATVEALVDKLDGIGTPLNSYDRLYIPILRGLRPLVQGQDGKFIERDVYLERTNADYFHNSRSGPKVFTGMGIFEDIKELLLGTEKQRKVIANFEKFLESTIFNKPVTLIPKYGDDVLHIQIGNDPQFPVYELGDGLQTLLTILFPLFKDQDTNLLVFIEEPDTHLHPKWQTLLLRALEGFQNCTFFISTHSSVFINSDHATLFRVDKKQGKTHVLPTVLKADKFATLKSLGYKPSDLLHSNYLLWVEGPSDKVYLKYLIGKMDSALVEQEHYSIMFYSGESYKHVFWNDEVVSLDLIQSINQHYGVIMDGDRTSEGEGENAKKQQLREALEGEDSFVWITKSRMIENYIPIEVFEQAVKTRYKLENVIIPTGSFDNRCKPTNPDAPHQFKQRIKISDKLFSRIQQNGANLGDIPAKELRKELKTSIENTSHQQFSIVKLDIAERVVNIGFDIANAELEEKLKALVSKIREANDLPITS